MAQGLPRTIAAILVAAGVVHCSLIAPSDQELMGGNKGGSSSSGGSGSGGGGDAGDAGDGGDGARSDATDGSQGGDGGPCNQAGDDCTTTAQCCSGLACNTIAGICVPCIPNGGACGGASTTCCSGSCKGNSCR